MENSKTMSASYSKFAAMIGTIDSGYVRTDVSQQL